MRLALNTHVMVYAEGVIQTPTDMAKHALAARFVARAASQTIVIPVQALAELHAVLVRKGGHDPAEASRRVRRWGSSSELVATDGQILDTALGACAAHNLHVFDAIILSACADAGCELLLSEDLHDGFNWRGVAVTNPFRASPDRRLASLLGP